MRRLADLWWLAGAGVLCGVLAVSAALRSGRIDPAHEFWVVLGFGLALAIATSLLLRREAHDIQLLDEHEAEQAALRDLTTLVTESVAPAEIFASVAEHLGHLFEANTAAISRYEPERNRGVIVGGWTREGQDLAGAEFALDGDTASAQVYRHNGSSAACRSIDYASSTDPISSLMVGLQASGGIAAPIYVANELWGALGAAYTEHAIPPGAEVRLERFARLVGLTISNREAWDRLARQASTDSLTGLANRRTFDERLTHEIARSRRHGRHLSVAVFDLDHFKRINDEHGHPEGDRVLMQFAQLLQSHAREGEVCARIGGEEFAWLMPETSELGAHTAADRVRAAFAAEPDPVIGTLTLSAGIAVAEPGANAADIIHDADQALYLAKNGGRNMTFMYSDAERPGAAERRAA